LEKELVKAFAYGARPLSYSAAADVSTDHPELLTLQLIDNLTSSHWTVSTGVFRTFPKTVPKSARIKLEPAIELWMQGKMTVNDLRKKTVI